MCNENMCGGNNMCSGGACGNACGKYGVNFHFLKKIVGLFFILVIFWFGTQLGELKTLTRMSEHRGGMMRGYDDSNYTMGTLDIKGDQTGGMMYGTTKK